MRVRNIVKSLTWPMLARDYLLPIRPVADSGARFS